MREIFKRNKRTIAKRQEHLNRICKIAEYVVPLIVSAVAATLISIMVLR